MNIDLIPTGDSPPENINVVIEVPVGGEPVKYEFDKKSGALFVDRILHTPMRYPANYGFVPHPLPPNGDTPPRPRPARRAGDRPLALRARLRGAVPADRCPQPRGRAWRRREADLRAGRHDFPILFGRRRAAGPAFDRASADRAFLHPL